jgi:HlyD family secretion protein
VDTGIANWKFTEVRSGLQAGDKVVLSVERKGVAAGVKAIAETPRAR